MHAHAQRCADVGAGKEAWGDAVHVNSDHVEFPETGDCHTLAARHNAICTN